MKRAWWGLVFLLVGSSSALALCDASRPECEGRWFGPVFRELSGAGHMYAVRVGVGGVEQAWVESNVDPAFPAQNLTIDFTLEFRPNGDESFDLYDNGVFIMTLRPDQASGQAFMDYLQRTRPAAWYGWIQDLWWALNTGASQACNQATALAGADALAAVAAAWTGNYAAYGALLVRFWIDFGRELQQCARG